METKQTAVEWLTNYMKANFHLTDESIEIFEQAKQMEKEQIMYAYCKGVNEYYKHEEGHKINWEQYYNETYGK